jgi:hypothetical protein
MTTSLLKLVAIVGAVGIAGVLVASAEGCTVLVNDQPPDDASTGVSSCDECQYQTCIGQWAVCGNSAECMAIYTCATAPGCDQNCVDQCYLAHQTGQSAYYALASCDSTAKQSAACTTYCTATPDASPDAPTETSAPDAGDDGGSTEAGDDGGAEAAMPDASDDASTPDASADDASAADASTDASSVQSCTDCSAQKCAMQHAACAPGSACDRYTGCLAACTTSACVTQCGTDNPDGQAASSTLGDCVTQQCSQECGLGH